MEISSGSERLHDFTAEKEEDAERIFWNNVLNAFADVCGKVEELNFNDEIADLRDLSEHEVLGALYDRLLRAWGETDEDPDDVIARYELFADREKE